MDCIATDVEETATASVAPREPRADRVMVSPHDQARHIITALAEYFGDREQAIKLGDAPAARTVLLHFAGRLYE